MKRGVNRWEVIESQSEVLAWISQVWWWVGAGSHTIKRWDGQVFFTQSLMTSSEIDVFLIGEPWVRERGFCANANMTFQTAKTSTVEQRDHRRKTFSERKKITFECDNKANGDRTACRAKGSRVHVCLWFHGWLLKAQKQNYVLTYEWIYKGTPKLKGICFLYLI